ncbi:MAG: hypothetical protein AAFW83_03645 [Pseudomonadota bacterium]
MMGLPLRFPFGAMVYGVTRGVLGVASLAVVMAGVFWIPFGAVVLFVLAGAHYGFLGAPANGDLMLGLMALGGAGSAALVFFATPLRGIYERFIGLKPMTAHHQGSPPHWRSALVMGGQAAIIAIAASGLSNASLPMGADFPETAFLDQYLGVLEGVFGPPKTG